MTSSLSSRSRNFAPTLVVTASPTVATPEIRLRAQSAVWAPLRIATLRAL